MASMKQATRSGNHSIYLHPELQRKQVQMLRFLTGNRKVDKLTVKDIEEHQQGFLTSKEMPEHKRQECAAMFKDIWKCLFGDSESIDRERVIAENARMMSLHAGTYGVELVKMYTRMFHCVDLNDDNNIDFNEFMIFSKATGFKDRALMKRVFDAIDVNGDGGISLDEFVGAYMKYEMDADVKLEDLPIYGLSNDSD